MNQCYMNYTSRSINCKRKYAKPNKVLLATVSSYVVVSQYHKSNTSLKIENAGTEGVGRSLESVIVESNLEGNSS